MKQKEMDNLKQGDVIIFNEDTEATIEGKTIVAGQTMIGTNIGDFGKTVLLSPLVELKKC